MSSRAGKGLKARVGVGAGRDAAVTPPREPGSAARGPAERATPRGDRAGVGEIQRARILAAMSDLVFERSAGGVTVADVVARSGVSRRTFYELFEDREDCFLAAFDLAVRRGCESAIPAYEAGRSWRERVAGGLRAVLVFLDDEPALGYLCVVGALGAGTCALERRARVTRALVAAVHGGRCETKAARRPDRLVAEGVVGAVLAIVHSRMAERSPKPLLGLLSALMAVVVLPYLGADAAQRELERPAPRPRRAARPPRDPLRDLDMRLTYRTVVVLAAIASQPGSSNRAVATAAGIVDQGQISKLLARLQALGLIANVGGDHSKGEPNAWELTPRGEDVQRSLQAQAA
jgi:AcrR family transcriptional regulator